MSRLKNILLFSVILFLGSCIHYNEDKDCSYDLRLYFVPSDNSRTTRALQTDDIKSIELFVYDSNNLLIHRQRDQDITLTPDYYMTIPLIPATYTFVAWCNVDGTIFRMENASQSNTFSQGRLIFTGDIDMPMLAYGIMKNEKINKSTDQRIVIPLVRNTYDINIKTEGLIPSSDIYRVEITDNEDILDFNNTMSRTGVMTHSSSCIIDAYGQASSSQTVLCLDENRKIPEIVFVNESQGDKAFFRGNLIDMILSLRNLTPPVEVDFNKVHTYNITLKFDINMKVTVNINHWDVVYKQTEDLNP